MSDIARVNYKTNPFYESIEIADYIKSRSLSGDTVAVLGSEPQICFYADRLSAASYIYVYPLMGTHKYAKQMQEEMISEIESANPKFWVVVNVRYSHVAGPDSDQTIFKWADKYQKEHYHLVGVVDIAQDRPTVYKWDKEALGYLPKSKDYVVIFCRNEQEAPKT